MAVSCAARSLAVTTGAVGTTFDVDFGFVPKLLIAWTTGRSSAVDAVGSADVRGSIGFAASASQRMCMACQSDDSPTTTATDRASHNAAIVRCLSIAGASAGLLDWDSDLASGIRFRIDEVFGAATTVHFWAVGGSDITDVSAVGTVTEPGSITTVDTNTLGFDPDVVLMLPFGISTIPGIAAAAKLGFGVAVFKSGGVVEQGCASILSEDNQGTSDSCRYITNADASARYGSSVQATMTQRVQLTQISGGFRSSFLKTGTANELFGYIAIKGGSWTLKEFQGTAADTTTAIQIRGLGTTARGGLVWHTGTSVEDTADTPVAHAEIGFGGWDSTSSRLAAALLMEDNAGNADDHTATEYDAIGVQLSDAGAVDSVVDISATDADGADYLQDLATVAFYGLTLLVGDTVGGTTFNQSVDGTLSHSGGLVKTATKILAGGLAHAGALATSRVIAQAVAGTLAHAGALVRVSTKVLAGGLANAGAVVRSTSRALAGSLAQSGALVTSRVVFHLLSGTLAQSGAIVRSTLRPLVGGLSNAGVIVRQAAKVLAGGLAHSGVLATARIIFKALAGALSSSSALSTVKEAGSGPAESGRLTDATRATRNTSVS